MHLHADVSDLTRCQIQRAVTAALTQLPLGLRYWVRAHLVEPRSIILCTSPDTWTHATFWLVTDDVGFDDTPMRIVFDGTAFGLAMTLEDGVSYFVHRSASFAEAVESM